MAGVSIVKLLPSTFSQCCLWKGVTMYRPHIMSGKWHFTSLRAEYWQKLFRVFCIENLSICPHLFNSIICINIRHRYLFILWHIIQLCFIYFVSKCSSFGNWEIFQLAPVFLWHTPISVYVLLRGRGGISISSGTIRYTRLILYTSCPSPRISLFFQEVLVPFIGGWH